jgi:hypothetical protein
LLQLGCSKGLAIAGQIERAVRRFSDTLLKKGAETSTPGRDIRIWLGDPLAAG